MATQPTSYLAWATDPNADLVQPSPAQIASGFAAGQRPTAGVINQLFHQAGAQLRWLAETSNTTSMTAALDPSIRLLGGGVWSWQAATSTLSWSEPFIISIPGLPDSQNTVAAGSLTLAAGQIAVCAANVPFTTQGDLTAGSTQVANLAFTQGVSVGMAVSGGTIPSGTTVTALADNTATLSQAPTASAANVNLTFVPQKTLTPTAQDNASAAVTAQTMVFARRYESDVPQMIVGINAGQMALRDGETKTLMGPGYGSSTKLTAAAALTQRQAVYANVSTGQVAPTNVSSTATANQAVFIGFSESACASGAFAHIVSSGVLRGFSSLVPGATYYCDPSTPGAITNGKPSATGQYVVPVGVALSASALLINPAAAALAAQVTADLTVSGNLTVKGAANLASLYGTGGTAQAPVLALQTSMVAADSTGASFTAPYITASTTMTAKAAMVVNGSLKTAAGIKRQVYMGGYASTSFPGGNQNLTTTHSGTDYPRRSAMAYPGSVMAISVSFAQAMSAATNVLILKNETNLVSANLTLASNGLGAYATFTKGTYPVVAGDVLRATINFSTSGLNVISQCEVTIESDA